MTDKHHQRTHCRQHVGKSFDLYRPHKLIAWNACIYVVYVVVFCPIALVSHLPLNLTLVNFMYLSEQQRPARVPNPAGRCVHSFVSSFYCPINAPLTVRLTTKCLSASCARQRLGRNATPVEASLATKPRLPICLFAAYCA